MKEREGFWDAFEEFRQGLEGVVTADRHAMLRGGLGYTVGPRYVRVTVGTAAYCFVDRTDGEVLKPNTWRGPRRTKRSRGNVFNPDHGLGQCGPYGLQYHG